MSCAGAVISAGTGSNQLPPSNAADGQVRPELLHPSVARVPFPFSRSQLSLALSIQKSKPEGVSTREYCLQLRKHIQRGKPLAEAERLSIDTSEFWKEQCSRLHSEKKALEARVAQLESIGRQGGGDLVTEEESSIFDCTAMAQLKGLKGLFSDEPSIYSPDLGHPRTLLLVKQSLALHRLLRDDKVSTDLLLSAIQSCISQMHSAVGDVCNIIKLNRNTAGVNQGIIRPLNTITAIFNICLKGLSHLCRDIKGRRYKGQAIYSIVHFFKTSLRHLQTLCVSEAARGSSNITNDQPASINTQFGANNKQTEPIFICAKFLASLLTCSELQKTYLCNIEVLEGMYATLLDDLGRIVSQTVFREHVSSSNKPGRIRSASEQISPPEMVLSVDLTGYYLATVLTSAMKGNLDIEKHSSVAMLAGPEFSGADVGKGQLLSRAKQRLQETLLKGVFGQDVEEWRNALKAPEVEDGWDTDTLVTPQVRGGTFMESVWSAVGWDLVLSR